MKFLYGEIEVNQILKIANDQTLTFIVYPVEPIEIRGHTFKSNYKLNIETCTNDETTCPYCITRRTLMKIGESDEIVRKFATISRYHLPIKVDINRLGITPGEYVYRFGKQIYTAYKQLITNDSMYKLDLNKPLRFTHNVFLKHSFPDFGNCYFTIGKKNLTVEKLCEDASSRIFV
jgi:hypothetical protein